MRLDQKHEARVAIASCFMRMPQKNELNETTLHKYWLNEINAYKLQDQKAKR